MLAAGWRRRHAAACLIRRHCRARGRSGNGRQRQCAPRRIPARPAGRGDDGLGHDATPRVCAPSTSWNSRRRRNRQRTHAGGRALLARIRRGTQEPPRTGGQPQECSASFLAVKAIESVLRVRAGTSAAVRSAIQEADKGILCLAGRDGCRAASWETGAEIPPSPADLKFDPS